MTRFLVARCSSIDPVDHFLALFDRHITGVDPATDVGVNLHRGHTTSHHDLTDHGTPALHHHVAVHGERTNATFNVATYATLDQDRRHFGFVVRYFSHVTITGREGQLTPILKRYVNCFH